MESDIEEPEPAVPTVNNEDEEEEGRKAKTTSRPIGPTRAEREEHEATHIPYRSWCRHCVRGRGRNSHHRKGEQAEGEQQDRQVPRISMDYHFMSKEDEDAQDNPIFVMVDDKTGAVFARACGSKGMGESGQRAWLAKSIVDELETWGYGGAELILKSDQETAIVSMLKAIAALRSGKSIMEHSAVGESASNGRIEEAGKRIREYTRTMLDQIEYRVGEELKAEATIVQWMVRWAAMLATRYTVGRDGRTPHERIKGRRCNELVVPFGELVWYKQLKLSTDSTQKLESCWHEGVWIGQNQRSNEVLIGTTSGVVKAFAVKRRPDEERWNKDAIINMQGTPEHPVPGMPGRRIPIAIHVDRHEAQEQADEPPRVTEWPRRMQLRRRHFVKHGYSESCAGCRAMQAGISQRIHNEACRRRMQEEMEKDEEGRRWIEKSRIRQHRGQERREEGGEPPRPVQREDHAREQGGGEEMDVEVPEIAPGGEEMQAEDSDDNTEYIWGPEAPDTETGMLLAVDVSEVYSPERVALEAAKLGLEPGQSMDLQNGWDFNKAADRKRAEEHQDKDDPLVLIGSPMCTMFSKLQFLSPWNDKKQVKYENAVEHLNWCASLYQKQLKKERIFLHEHPEGVSSWELPAMRALAADPRVYTVVTDQCMFDQQVINRNGQIEGLAKKRTRFLTNSKHIADELNRQCDGSHSHVQLVGGRAAQTAKYTVKMCQAICRGIRREKMERQRDLKSVRLCSLKKGEKLPDKDEFHDPEEARSRVEMIKAIEFGEAFDDVSGVRLDAALVKKAREEEMDYIRKKEVYTKIPRQQAERDGIKVIKSRWIDINKGDDKAPRYRSRLVAKEFRTPDREGENMFAGTPPLEALKMLISEAATMKPGKAKKGILIADVSRAFFEADARRKVCVELAPEDRTEKDVEMDMVGLLNKSMYGTRDAAINWQEEVAKSMKAWGFRRGRYNPCVYVHAEMDIKVIVHGDDFVAVADEIALTWLSNKLKERFEIKASVVGHGKGKLSEARILNRTIRITPQGWEYEADQRHAELVIAALNLTAANGVKTPGEDEKNADENHGEEEEELGREDATRYRAIVARANYLAMDRADLQFPVKELCRKMAAPTKADWSKLKRVGRYLLTNPRLVSKYEWQEETQVVEVYGDSNWAGCKRTGRSTSGGVAMRGTHLLRSWSHTQKTVALSSAEAELTALVKGACEGLGIAALYQDVMEEMDVTVYADASAALGVVGRLGAGKLRHVHIAMLWVQERSADGSIKFRKVWGGENPGDLLTKNLTWALISRHLEILRTEMRDGRAVSSPELQKGSSSFLALKEFIRIS